MGLFDSLFKQAESVVKSTVRKEATKAVNKAVSEIGKGRNHTETFTFNALPNSVDELKALPEANLDSAFKTAALTLAVLCKYKENPEVCFEMLNFLKGPEEVSPFEKQFINECLSGKEYKPFSYFAGATPENAYKPDVPYKITVIENPYSFDNENWAMLYVQSGGADNPRGVKLRKKPSTNQWFLNDIQCLSDIRIPTEEDKWA